MKTVIEIRLIDKPMTGRRVDFEVEGLKNIEVAEIYGNFLAAKQSALDGEAYYVSSVMMDSNNFIMNPSPSYWDLDRVSHNHIKMTRLSPVTPIQMAPELRKKSQTF